MTPRPALSKVGGKALYDNRIYYTHFLGLIELRQVIVAYFQARYGVELDPERVLVTAGTILAIVLIFGALLRPDDEDNSILEYTGEAFVLDGFSKLYAMTG